MSGPNKAFSVATLLAALATSQCGGRARDEARDPEPPQPPAHASQIACLTSEVCPTGERCDGGKCESDATCPPPQAPLRLLDGSIDEEFPHGYILIVDDQEHLVAGVVDPAAPRRNFLNLRTGQTTFIDPGEWSCGPGGVRCYDELEPCFCDSEDSLERVWFSDFELVGDEWVPDKITVTHSPDAGIYSFRTFGPDTAVLVAPSGVYRIDLLLDRAEHLLELGDRRLWRIFPETPQRSARLAAIADDSESTTYWVAELSDEPKWRELGTTPTARHIGGLIPAGDKWFVVQDSVDDLDIAHVWSVGGTAAYVGTIDVELLPELITTYSAGVELSPRGVGIVATGSSGVVRSHLVDLTFGSVDPIGSVELPGDRFNIKSVRHLACDAVDLIVTGHMCTPDSCPVDAYYSVRITSED